MPLWKRFGIHTSAQGSQGNVRKQSRKMQETTFAARAKQPSKSLHTGCCDLLWHLKTHARLHVISCDSDSCHVTRVIHMAHVTRMFHGCLPSCRRAVSPSCHDFRNAWESSEAKSDLRIRSSASCFHRWCCTKLDNE